ncbi:hypothetical protein CSOJ01_11746 [Colletotrichum sojae]|uniref:Uncharacterized protein n=1 Tax=Colletotrichum sojae TaxID=2175907 RepID=A0A8H6MN86_9PEZI|nr:hypothetical protein CSOJ01_11746 [Colletotrichum sojae]
MLHAALGLSSAEPDHIVGKALLSPAVHEIITLVAGAARSLSRRTRGRLAHELWRRLVHAAVIVFDERQRMTVLFPTPWDWVCLVVDTASNSQRAGPGYDGPTQDLGPILEPDGFATAAMMTKTSARRPETHRVLPDVSLLFLPSGDGNPPFGIVTATSQTHPLPERKKKPDEDRRSHRLPPSEDPVDLSDAAAAPGGYRLIR